MDGRALIVLVGDVFSRVSCEQFVQHISDSCCEFGWQAEFVIAFMNNLHGKSNTQAIVETSKRRAAVSLCSTGIPLVVRLALVFVSILDVLCVVT